MSKTNETPLMKQYNTIKRKYPDALLLFRVGDFYETFGEDAKKASKILDIVLTKRANGTASKIDLAGFPHHSMDTYLPKLVRAGYRVAICDQLEDPKQVKGIVKRGVTELVTPGLTLNDNVLDNHKNNYLSSIYSQKGEYGIAFLDISTGEFFVSSGNEEYIDKLIQSFYPSEIIYSKNSKKWFQEHYEDHFSSFSLEEWIFGFNFCYEKLTQHFKVSNLKGYGIEELMLGISAAGAILYYLDETEHKKIDHIKGISRINKSKYVWLDRFTIKSLELTQPLHPDSVTLLDILNKTLTPMGSRLLRKWIVFPLKNKTKINHRLDIVQTLVNNRELQEILVKHLDQIGDLERIVGKLVTGKINPRELLQLNKSLSQISPIKKIISDHKVFNPLHDLLNICEKLIDKLSFEIDENTPILIHNGGVIAKGVNQELDELRKISGSGKEILNDIKNREIIATGITSLKISYNKVFGYYLEVSNTHKDKAPQSWIRKQTLVNAERYITEELKMYEDKILTAESQIQILETNIFSDIILFAQSYIDAIQQNAKIIATLDCLSCFAQIAISHQYTKPTIIETDVLDIKGGRHPIIEQHLPSGETYVTNDIFINNDEQQIMIITGPNMAGKSALLRQTALITLMAQIGCFVPAQKATIGIVDKIFTRVGASDNLSKGESTFMVEMNETASILNNLSNHSLILMDEIGRGTSTYDGLSIAWSILEFIHNHPKFRAKTLFATHYHELNSLAEDFPRIKNFNVHVKEIDKKVLFMRKLKAGGCEHSFGIHVAQMAGMPSQVISRATQILKYLENIKQKNKKNISFKELPTRQLQLNIFETDNEHHKILSIIRRIDINSISPIEALLKLKELKEVLTKK